MLDYTAAAWLGLLEGLTEFIPVSSTGHLLLAGRFLGFQNKGFVFEVVIQLGAILALASIYAVRLGHLAREARKDPAARHVFISVTLAFLPAVVVGVLAHDFIKTVLFASPVLISINLIVGGFVLVIIDRVAPKPRYFDAMKLPFTKSIIIGFCQCVAMIPGVSRSGATIVGALMLGVEKRAAAEFSFLLSMPTMGAAVAYDILKSRDQISSIAWGEIAIGFVVAFITAMVVVKWVLFYVERHGYALFGWWRIIIGVLALYALYIGF